MAERASLTRGRTRQKSRTRKALVEAALRLKAAGRPYTLDEVAEAAEVSRATAYRYFASVSALNAELSLVVRLKTPEELLDPRETDPVKRLHRVHAHLLGLVAPHEAEFRAYIRESMTAWERNRGKPGEPRRAGRRVDLIEAALGDMKKRLGKAEYQNLVHALSLVTFFEPYVVLKDIFGLSDDRVDTVMRWAISRLVESAERRSRTASS